MKNSLLIIAALVLMLPVAAKAQVCGDCVVVKINYGPMSKAQADLLAAKIKNDNSTAVRADIAKVQIPCKNTQKKHVKRPVKKSTAALKKKAVPVSQKNLVKAAVAGESNKPAASESTALYSPPLSIFHHGDGASTAASTAASRTGMHISAYSGSSQGHDKAKATSASADDVSTRKQHIDDGRYKDCDKHDRNIRSRHQSYQGKLYGDHHGDMKPDCGLGSKEGNHQRGDHKGISGAKATGGSHGKSGMGSCGGHHGTGHGGHHR